MTNFSPQLVERLQKHFREKHNAEVSPEQAEQYLDSLADLYLLVVGRAAGRGCPEGDPTAAPVILDSLHTQSDENH